MPFMLANQRAVLGQFLKITYKMFESRVVVVYNVNNVFKIQPVVAVIGAIIQNKVISDVWGLTQPSLSQRHRKLLSRYSRLKIWQFIFPCRMLQIFKFKILTIKSVIELGVMKHVKHCLQLLVAARGAKNGASKRGDLNDT